MFHLATRWALVLALAVALLPPASAQTFCATSEQAGQIRSFYHDNPGTMPTIAARKLKLPEALVASGLPAEQRAATSAAHFAEVWGAMTRWNEATFLIMKGANVFEIRSAIAPGAPSRTSDYYNIEYKHPLRGHLRPDLYASIYVVAIPGKEGNVARGVLFYDAEGASVFGAFISGDGPPPPQNEIAKFDEVMALVRKKPPVCSG